MKGLFVYFPLVLPWFDDWFITFQSILGIAAHLAWSHLCGSFDVSCGLKHLKLEEETLNGRFANSQKLGLVHRKKQIGKTILFIWDLLDGHKALSGLE